MKEKLSKKFWLVVVIFSLTGQVAWVVENMYFNVFIYNIFNATPKDISLMVSLSAVSATLTSIFIGALSDRIGKRKLFMCLGYILWGLSILAFSLVRIDIIDKLFPLAVSSASIGISLVIILDCVMTFFGSSANDAAFNAWLTDSTNSDNRGQAEGINAMMPLVAILVVFGGFMALDLKQIASWSLVFSIIGIVVILIGIIGFFIIKEPKLEKDNSGYLSSIIYGFKPSTIKENKELYLSLLAFIVFNISIQIFMPYLIIYYEVSLQMSNYVLIMAPAIILASIVTALWGKVYDKKGFLFSSSLSLTWLILGYLVLFFTRQTAFVFIGSLLMMSGYLSGMAVFGAIIRETTPSGKAGRLQGIRIVSQVLVPGVVGPYIGRLVLQNAETITNSDGTTSFIPSANIFLAALIALLFILPFIFLIVKTQKPKINNLKTKYKVGEIPFNEYPRPMMKRDSFINLNGNWDFKVLKDEKTVYSGEIIVPFPPESQLSKVNRITKKGEVLEYTKTVNLLADKIVLLHFGAVDTECEVFVNSIKVGENKGGYIPFSFDITKYLVNGENQIKIRCVDELNVDYPYGKQTKKRGGMWYTSVSGIWQTVWLEQVEKGYIESIKVTPTISSVKIEVTGGEKEKQVLLDGKTYAFTGDSVEIEIDNAKLWSPENPHLYNFEVISGKDKISSYFALREIEISGGNILLNKKPYFFHGVLDQGYYPDGLFLPANEQGYKDDILLMKELGFNMLRKHIKIEPQIFYYYCDTLGMIVFQDMINNGKYSFLFDTALPTINFKKNKIGKVTKRQQEIFLQTAKDTISLLYNHPSVVYYTIFNEGWGQHNGSEIYKILKELDKTRVYDTASGWFNNVLSDVQSEHVYFKKLNLKKVSDKPLVLSEFGGYSYKILEHSYNLTNTYGYKVCTEKTFTKDIEELYYNQVIPQIKNGLCVLVLTQLSDVEDETNGLITYDREVVKIDKGVMQDISKALQKSFNEYIK